MIQIFTEEYPDADVEYELWECDENKMPYAFLGRFDSYADAEKELAVLTERGGEA